MATKSFAPNAVNLFVGTPRNTLTGNVTITMKTSRYYTDNSRLVAGTQYIVPAEWAKYAIEKGWATDTNSYFPVADTPSEPNLTAAQATAVANLLVQTPIPVYLFGDSLFARSTREISITAMDVVATASGFYIVPTPAIIGVYNEPIRFYGFAESRLNATATLQYVSSQARAYFTQSNTAGMTFGTSVLASYPVATTGQRCYNETLIFTEVSLPPFAQSAANKQYQIQNLALGGHTSTGLAGIAATLFATLAPGILVLESTVNTFSQSETFAQVQTNYIAMIAAAKAAGHTIILTTPTTFSSVASGYVANNQGYMAQAALMRKLALQYDLTLLDLNSIWVDPTSTTAQPVSGYVQTSDGIHWTQPFIQAACAAFDAALVNAKSKTVSLQKLTSIVDAKYTQAGAANNANSTNVLTNGQMFGTAGTGTATGGPDGWFSFQAGSPTVVYAKTASNLNAGDGTWQWTYSGTSGTNQSAISANCFADCVAGSKVRATAQVNLPADVANCFLGMGLQVYESTGGSSAVFMGLTGMVAGATYKAGTYTLVTEEWVVPVGVVLTQVRMIVQLVATGGTLTSVVVNWSNARIDVRP